MSERAFFVYNELVQLVNHPVRQLSCKLTTQLPALPFSCVQLKPFKKNITRLPVLKMRMVIQSGFYSG